MKFAASIIFTLGCVIACNQAFAGKVYKWVDDKGVVHFSAQPPLNKQSEVIKPQISRDAVPTEESGNAPSADAKVKESKPTDGKVSNAKSSAARSSSAAKQDDTDKDPERCETARKNEQTLRTYSRIKVEGDDGESRFLTDEEKQQKLDEANMAIQESCE